MSGFSYAPVSYISACYNPLFYSSIDASGYLTVEFGNSLYLSKNDPRIAVISGYSAGVAQPGVAVVLDSNKGISSLGSVSCSSLTVNGVNIDGSSSQSPYLTGISAGTASPSKALVCDASTNISGIATLSATTLSGTLSNANQPNITALGTLTSLTVSASSFTLGGNAYSTSNLDLVRGVSAGSASANKALVLDGTSSVSGIGTLSATTLTGTLSAGPQPNITSLGTMSSLSVSGTVSCSTLSATTLSGALSSGSQPNITSLGTLSGLSITKSGNDGLIITNPSSSSLTNLKLVSDSHTYEVGIRGSDSTEPFNSFYIYSNHNGIKMVISPNGCVGISNIYPAYTLDVGGDISLSGSFRNGSTVFMNSSGVIQVAAQPNITSLGTLSSLSVGGDISLTGSLRNGATVFMDSSGLIQVAGQTNITSLGTLSGLNVSGAVSCGSLTVNGVVIDGASSSAYLSGITPGTAAASKCVVLDANKAISGMSQILMTSSVDEIFRCSRTSIFHITQDSLSSYNVFCGTQSNHDFNLVASNTPGLTIQATTANVIVNSKLAIGTTSPNCRLHLGNKTDAPSGILGICNDPSNTANAFTGLSSNGNVFQYLSNISHRFYCSSTGASIGTLLATLKAEGLSIGGTTGAANLNILNSSSPTFRIGKTESTQNSISMIWQHAGDGSADNALRFEHYGSSKSNWHGNGWLEINRSSRLGYAPLVVDNSGTYSWTTDHHYYDVWNNTYTSLTNGSISLAGWFAGSIFLSQKIITQSDRRVKHDIRSFDIEVERYMAIEPVQYVRNGSDGREIGLIAQDTLPHCPSLVSMLPNSDLKREREDDPPDGWQFSVSYDRVSIVNMAIIKKLVRRVEELEERLSQLTG